MPCILPVRRRVAISTVAVSPRRFALVAVAAAGPDAVRTLVRDDEFVGTFDQARRHADLLAVCLTEYHGRSVEGQVLDRDSGLLIYATTGGAK